MVYWIHKEEAMQVFIVAMATYGSNVPRIEVSYHRSEGEARAAYDGCLDLVGSDHSKILLVRVDEETMTQTIIDSFEGTDEEFDGE